MLPNPSPDYFLGLAAMSQNPCSAIGVGCETRTLSMLEPMPAKVESTCALSGPSPVSGKPIIFRFDGGQLSSDGAALINTLPSIKWPILASPCPPRLAAAKPGRGCLCRKASPWIGRALAKRTCGDVPRQWFRRRYAA